MNNRPFSGPNLVALAGMLLIASCSTPDSDQAQVSFHLQAERPQKQFTFYADVGSPPVHYSFNKSPHFDVKDFVAFQPFPAGDGTYGATFQLDDGARNRLLVISETKTGHYICTRVNGHPVYFLKIDSRIEDGRIVVWKGLPGDLVEEFRQVYPLINSGAQSW